MTSISRESWITPEEQLERLVLHQLEGAVNVETLRNQGLKSAVHSILNRSDISLALSEREGPPSLFDLCVERLTNPLPSSLTNWYKALERIGALQDRIPALPRHIYLILGSKCPIYSTNENPITIENTHSLYLIPPGTINELERRVRNYGVTFFQGENPFKFKNFWNSARIEHADVPYSEPQWVLISKGILPGSRNHTYEEQVHMVKTLKAKSFTDYQVPTLREAIGAIFLEKVATNKCLYQTIKYTATNLDNNQDYTAYDYTFTNVNEKTLEWRLSVGGFDSSGLSVSDSEYGYQSANKSTGIAALRKL